ncbi:MAG: extracellular solute-binding protein [Eubacterium sp.]|nr:extracellular solute-binding protein [Eubacterium sp.]
MANIREVAALAGVSTATVSNVLNQTKPVSTEKRRRVLDAARTLHYIPNTNARDLRRKTTQTIGVIMTDIKSQFHAEIFNTLSSEIQKKGYSIQAAFTDEVINTEQQVIEQMISINVDGIILITCQSEKDAAFWDTIRSSQIPIIFVERRIQNITENYIGFNNYKTIYDLTSLLLERGYHEISLFCGLLQYSSELDCVRGFSEAYKNHGMDVPDDRIRPVDMIKESAMESCLQHLHSQSTQAIIGTSREITDGILLAANYNSVKPFENLLVIGFGEENWDHAFRNPGHLVISRSASTLGELTAEKLFELIESPALSDPVFHELEEYNLDISSIPSASVLQPVSLSVSEKNRPLELLLIENSSEYALTLMLPHFERKHDICVHYTVVPQNKALERIRGIYEGRYASADVIMYDNHWLDYLVQNNYLAELTEFLDEKKPDLTQFIPELSRNFRKKDRIYGIPYTGGSQMLFYRQDLFEDPVVTAAYQQMYQLPLRPPRTWTEFNHIARFFTRAYNPDSPTAFGTAFAGDTPEVMSCEILPRLWALGGKLWDSYGQPTFDTNANQNAYRILLETTKYAADDPLTYSLDDTVKAFMNEKAAMVTAFSEYAPSIIKNEKHDFQRKVSYYHLPGRKTVSAGYCFGLNPFSEARGAAFDFLSWICSQNTSYLFTLFSGAPTFSAPYHNHALQRLYPWLYYTEKSIQFSQDRVPPMRRDRPVIPPNQFEELICRPLRRMILEGIPADQALRDAQEEAVRLFTMYGTPVRKHF